MARLALTLFVVFLLPKTMMSQITFDVDPIDFTLECNDAQNDIEIENYLNGLSACNASCGTNPLITWDYSDPGNFEGDDVIVIEITAEDDCGVSPDLVVTIDIAIEDTQVPIITSPAEDFSISCDDLNLESEIQIWLGNNANAIISDECTSAIDLLHTNDFVGIYNIGTVSIGFTVEDGNGNSFTYNAALTIFDTSPPVWDVLPQDLNLICNQSGIPQAISDWINANGNGVASDCSDSNDLIFTTDYDFVIPDCGIPKAVNFTVEDESSNTAMSVSANINIEGTSVNFNAELSNNLESAGTKEICLNIMGASSIDDTTFDVEILSVSTALNGVDYSALPVIQSYVFPAGSMSDVCFDVIIIDDTPIEFLENIIFKITSAIVNGQNAIGSDSMHVFNIIDNDDNDSDGVNNILDNCVDTYNPDQLDVDEDDIGDACDANNMVNTLIQSAEHIYVEKHQGGIIMTSPSGNCFLIYVSDAGVVTSLAVDCP